MDPLARYETTRPLGGGGSGSRQVARDLHHGDLVVVKTVPVGEGAPAEALRNERAVLARLDDVAGVVTVRDAGETVDGRPYLVTALAGRSLAEVLDDRPEVRPGRPSWTPVIGAAAGLARTLTRVHERGLVHLDVTPANVAEPRRPGPEAGWVLLDFGRARPIGDSSAGGTRPYSAPECWVGAPAGPAADVFGWAATVWTVLTGHPPFGYDDGDLEVRLHHLPPGPAPAWFPADVAGVLGACLRADPRNRPRMTEVAGLLEAAVSSAGARPRRGWPAWWPRRGKVVSVAGHE